MKILCTGAVLALAALIVGNAAFARNKPKTDYSPQECAKLDREYQALQAKEKRHGLTPAERARMGHIDDINNIYCS
jgi:hypothetical protein